MGLLFGNLGCLEWFLGFGGFGVLVYFVVWVCDLIKLGILDFWFLVDLLFDFETTS